MNTTKIKPQNLATPGTPMSQEEFVALIQQAEKGPFYTLEESKKMFNRWRKKRYKL